MYRVNETFAQVSEDIGDRSVSVQANSVDFVRMAAACFKKLTGNHCLFSGSVLLF